MKKTWVFFMLRMTQLKYDKIGLFFSYVFPVLLLLGIGFPVELASNNKIGISYVQSELSPEGERFLARLAADDMVAAHAYKGGRAKAEEALRNNEIQHLLTERPASDGTPGGFELKSNSLRANAMTAIALVSILEDVSEALGGEARITRTSVEVSRRSSYLAVLLPGVIALTILTIGISGFGSVLLSEEGQGLYKNLKTIDVSPVPFLLGLFLSRLLVAYTVAIAMFAISVFVLGVPGEINFLLLFVVMSLGASMFLGIGLVIFAISPSRMAYSGIVNLVQMPMIILGGVFFSTTIFPEWLQPIAKYSPMAPFTTALRDLMFGGVGFHNMSVLYPSLATLSVWLVLMAILGRMKFRW